MWQRGQWSGLLWLSQAWSQLPEAKQTLRVKRLEHLGSRDLFVVGIVKGDH